ncbi:hypothetical protein HPB51_007942 [Rhipicephalus microplus]|uniref:Uncharacterized protein n=1 Tax=Rhipicephalus microplus TaxID=6941 RepID=A0A9J6EMT4_RHIMP|nr:hypothetical protein HPB51_007942 [Rhipicephalus microplus]
MGRARGPEFQGWAILRWASGPSKNPEPYLLLPRLRALPPVPLRGDRARERARGRAKALTLCADGHTQGSAHEHAQAEGAHRGAGPLGASSRHQLPRSGPPGLHAARPRTELRHRTDGLRTMSSTWRPHRLRQKTVRYCLTISRSTPYVKCSSSVSVLTGRNMKLRCTDLLCALADGTKLRPYITLKRKRLPKIPLPADVVVRAHENA